MKVATLVGVGPCASTSSRPKVLQSTTKLMDFGTAANRMRRMKPSWWRRTLVAPLVMAGKCGGFSVTSWPVDES